jgi:hypothetical protein
MKTPLSENLAPFCSQLEVTGIKRSVSADVARPECV